MQLEFRKSVAVIRVWLIIKCGFTVSFGFRGVLFFDFFLLCMK